MTAPKEFLSAIAQRHVDTGRNKSPRSVSEAQERAEANSFLPEVKKDLKIKSIYYPGCGEDTTLEPIFRGNITYLDGTVFRSDAGKKGFIGDFTNPPEEIADKSFDAAFIRDLHLHLQNVNTALSNIDSLDMILRKIKDNGYVIYGIRRDCNEWIGELNFLQEQLGSPLDLGYQSNIYKVFGKRLAVT